MEKAARAHGGYVSIERQVRRKQHSLQLDVVSSADLRRADVYRSAVRRNYLHRAKRASVNYIGFVNVQL